MENQPQTKSLNALLEAIADQLSPEAARSVAALHAPDSVLDRLDELAEKATSQDIRPSEQAEYDALLQVAHAVTMIQAKLAERGISGDPDAPPRIVSADVDRLDGMEDMLGDLDEIDAESITLVEYDEDEESGTDDESEIGPEEDEIGPEEDEIGPEEDEIDPDDLPETEPRIVPVDPKTGRLEGLEAMLDDLDLDVQPDDDPPKKG